MNKLTDKRIQELLRAESKLNALEAGGVDNWQHYDDSLAPWRKENAFDELLEQTIEDIQTTFAENAGHEFPSVPEAGINIWCEDEDALRKVLVDFINANKEIEKDGE
mgnify:CR=1 FL=1